MMFANYAARHFLRKHKKVIGKGLRLKLIKKQAGNSIWVWPFVLCTERRKGGIKRKRKQENRKSKGQFPVKDSVSDVISLLI